MSAPFPIPHVRALWRPEQFNRIGNPDFETDTSGWSVAAGINGAGTSITRDTTDPHSGSGCGRLVTPATAGTGVNYDLGSWSYYPEADWGTMYAAIVWLKRISGPTICKLILGSQGTSTERDELVITDLSDTWRPYRIVWSPRSSTITDAQLAIVTVTGEALTVDIDDVALYQPEGFTQVENGIAEELDATGSTTGWDDAGTYIASAASYFGTASSNYYVGANMFNMTTTTTDGSGVNYALADRLFTSGRTYRLRLAVTSSASDVDFELHLGSDGTPADRASTTGNIPTAATWAIHTLDWTPSADRTDAVLAITNAAAESVVIRFDAVEVYEASDELGTNLQTLKYKRGAAFDGAAENPGSFTLKVRDDGRYTPKNASADLYGSLSRGKAVLGRADFDGAGHGLFHGNLRNIAPDPKSGTSTFTGDDPLRSLGAVPVRIGFAADSSYSESRAYALSQAMLLGQSRDRDDTFGQSRLDLSEASIEGDTFFDQTASETTLSSYLAALNAATGTIHRIVATYNANAPWKYTTTDRATLTDNLQLVMNGTFDSDLGGWTVADSTSSTWQDGLGPDGDACLRTIGDGVGIESVYQSCDVTEGVDYVFSADVWAETKTDIRLFIRWKDSGGSTLSTDYLVAWNTVQADSTWESYEDTLTAPSGAVSAQVYCSIIACTDEFRWDNISLLPALAIIDEDFAAISNHSEGLEALENRQRVTWQSFEEIPLPPDINMGGGYTWVAKAVDTSVSSTYTGDIDIVGPFLHFTDDRIGYSDIPSDPRVTNVFFRTPGGGDIGLASMDPGLHGTMYSVYEDSFVPIDMAVGDEQDALIETSIPIADPEVVMYGAGSAATVHTELLADPKRLDIRWWATAAEVIDFFGISGTPWLPLDAREESVEDLESVLLRGQHDGPAVSAYVAAKGQAEGIGGYRNWRYGEPRTRLRLKDTLRDFTRTLTTDVTDQVELSADDWSIVALPMVVRGLEVEVTRGAHRWDFYYDLEELPSHTHFHILDDAAKGLDDAVVLAY